CEHDLTVLVEGDLRATPTRLGDLVRTHGAPFGERQRPGQLPSSARACVAQLPSERRRDIPVSQSGGVGRIDTFCPAVIHRRGGTTSLVSPDPLCAPGDSNPGTPTWGGAVACDRAVSSRAQVECRGASLR